MQVGGSYTLYVTLGGHHLPGSPFNIDVLAGPIELKRCRVYRIDGAGFPLKDGTGVGPSASNDEGIIDSADASSDTKGDDMIDEHVVAGEDVLFAVELHDKCGNPCHNDRCISRVSSAVSGPSAPVVRVAAVEDMATMIEAYKEAGAAAKLSPVRRQTSQVVVLNDGDDGDEAQLRRAVTLRNFASNGSGGSRGGSSWGSQSVQDALGSSARAHQQVVAENERRVHASISFSVCGVHEVRFFLDSPPHSIADNEVTPLHGGVAHKQPLPWGYYRFHVDPAPAVASACFVYTLKDALALSGVRTAVRGTVTAAAGSPLTLVVACFDKHGNRSSAGVDVEAALTGPVPVKCRVLRLVDYLEEDDVHSGDVGRGGGGGATGSLAQGDPGSVWLIESSPVVAGTYSLEVLNSGNPVGGTPLEVQVSPGPADALFSSICDEVSPEDTGVVAGTPTSPARFALTPTSGSGSGSGGAGGGAGAGSGIGGASDLRVTLPRRSRHSSATAPLSPAVSTAELEGLALTGWTVWRRDAIATRTVGVDARDAWGNSLVKGGDKVTAELKRARHGTISSAPGVVEVGACFAHEEMTELTPCSCVVLPPLLPGDRQ